MKRSARELPEGALYLTADQLATIVQVSTKTLTRLAQRDPSFPVLSIGGVVRYPRERVLTWFRQREQGRPQSQKPSLSGPKPQQIAIVNGSCAVPCAVEARRE